MNDFYLSIPSLLILAFASKVYFPLLVLYIDHLVLRNHCFHLSVLIVPFLFLDIAFSSAVW